MTKNHLYYGDNLPILRKYIKDESVDLAYIDPPFNSKRNYNQIYNEIGKNDKAQAQAFIDTWEWDHVAKEGIHQILENERGRFTPLTIELVKGLRNFLKESSLFAYLVSMTLRIVEIHRVLKPTGSFYLHCDPTASHYLKLLMDAVFDVKFFRSELIWKRSAAHGGSVSYNDIHDVLLYYSKAEWPTWNSLRAPYDERYIKSHYSSLDKEGRHYQLVSAHGAGNGPPRQFGDKMIPPPLGRHWMSQEHIDQMMGDDKVIMTKSGMPRYKRYLDETEGTPLGTVWDDIPPINSQAAERLGYPTQKPEALLERIIKASSNEGDTVLDAYCGCGTTVAVSQRLNRRWVGIDITYQSISLMLKRFKETFGQEVLSTITLGGIPTDMASATALAHKQDDRIRKEFEKWAVLTYSEDRATINQKKGADGGIDGTAHFMTSKEDNEKIIFQVKSGNVGLKDIRDLRGTIEQAHAPLGILITLQEPTQAMTRAAHAMGLYSHPLMQRNYDKIQIVTIKEMLEKGVRLTMPLTHEVVKVAVAQPTAHQLELLN